MTFNGVLFVVEVIGWFGCLWAPALVYVGGFFGRQRLAGEVDQLRGTTSFFSAYISGLFLSIAVPLVLFGAGHMVGSVLSDPQWVEAIRNKSWRLAFISVGLVRGLSACGLGAYGIGGKGAPLYFVAAEDFGPLRKIALTQIVWSVVAAIACLSNSGY